MAVELVVPQLGESITEAVVGKWHKQVGEAVQVDEPIVVLETDKVTIDVAAPSAGSLTRIAFTEGSKVKIGDVLGSITEGGAAAAPPEAKTAPKTAAANPVPPVASADGRTPKVTPTAQNVAEANGIDAAQVKGSGVAGRVMKEDVLVIVEHGREPTPVPPAPMVLKAPAPSIPSGPRTNAAREERVRMTPLRRRVAERLLQAQNTAAMLTTFNEVDMGEVMALRKRYVEKFQTRHGVKLGFMSFFVRATLEALKAFPMVNAEIDGEEVIFKHYYDIGVAVSGTRGLVVPVVRDADTLSMAGLEKTIAELANKARTDKLTLADLSGGTFTLTNGGIFGSMMSTPILNPPQVAILGMHNIVDRAMVKDGQIVIRPMMYLAVTYDHRLIDGREAVQFLVRIKECIEDPERLLLEV